MLRFINTRQALNTAGNLLVQKLKAQLKIDKTYATKELYDSIVYDIDLSSKEYKLNILSNSKMAFVDKGRKPGAPPSIGEILRWADAKGIRPRTKKGKFIENSKSNRFWMAKNIAESIGENGTIKRFGGNGRGSNIIEFVLQNNREKINNALLNAYQIDLHEHIQQNVIKK